MTTKAKSPVSEADGTMLSGDGQKILLVDDDAAIRRFLLRVLSAEGYRVLPAANGEEALEFASAARFDLVLLDLNMPEKDGWETFEELTVEHPLLPVIVITAKPNQLFPALAAGVGALLEKPLDLTRLLQEILRLLRESRQERLARLAGRPSVFGYVPPGESRNGSEKTHLLSDNFRMRDDVNGVNVVNRIAPAMDSNESLRSSTPPGGS
jgi:DNA-binding response OmpR family regulator